MFVGWLKRPLDTHSAIFLVLEETVGLRPGLGKVLRATELLLAPGPGHDRSPDSFAPMQACPTPHVAIGGAIPAPRVVV